MTKQIQEEKPETGIPPDVIVAITNNIDDEQDQLNSGRTHCRGEYFPGYQHVILIVLFPFEERTSSVQSTDSQNFLYINPNEPPVSVSHWLSSDLRVSHC